MPRKPKEPLIVCDHFAWRLFRRDGDWYADGRAVGRNLGKHSLNTRDHGEAIAALRELDRAKAVELGLAAVVPAAPVGGTDLSDGWASYLEHSGRPLISGGVAPKSLQRYRAVRDHHVRFCSRRGLRTWSDLDKASVDRYVAERQKAGAADRTLYLEAHTIVQVHKWLIDQGRIPADRRFRVSMVKAEGSDTHCWAPAEVEAMVALCRSRPNLRWFGDILTALACTGMRIAELAGLRWPDVHLDAGMIVLADERSSARRRGRAEIRTTKARRGRKIPIHPDLEAVLKTLPRLPDGRVFHGPKGGKVKPDKCRQVLIRKVLKPLETRFPTPSGEIGFQDGRLHSFRHYFCSQAFADGAPEAEVKEWLGHRESAMVAHCRHLRDEDGKKRMKTLPR